MRSGHNRAVDWWSLGALMYDMLTGAVSSNMQSADFFFGEQHLFLFLKLDQEHSLLY